MPSEEEDMRDQLGEWFDPTVHKLHRRGASAHYRAYSAGVKGQKPRSPFASSSDIDLFLVDPEDATGDASQGASNKRALERVKYVFSVVKRNAAPLKVLAVKTDSAVSFVIGFPHRHIQVVLKKYTCTEDVLTSFDLDCWSAMH